MLSIREEKNDWFEIKRRLRQGCRTLLNIFMNVVLREARVTFERIEVQMVKNDVV